MNTCDALYFADYLVTQNESREVVEKGGIAVSGSRIAAVGSREEILSSWEAPRKTELGRAVLMPGLSNGHTHVAMSFLRGRADDKPLMDWLHQDIFPIEAKLTKQMVSLSSELSCVEMIRTGTTSFFDMYPLADGVFEAADKTGLRAVLGEGVMIYPTASFRDGDEALSIVRDQASRWRGHSRIRGAVAPHAIYTTTPEYLVRCHDLARELGWVFAMHLAETLTETRDCLSQRGVRPVEYCRDLGLLGSESTFFHMVHVNDSDLDLIAASGSAIVHNPGSNMKLASGVAPLGAMIERGIPLGLGTDGPASNNAQNMVREMYVAALLQKVDRLDATALPASRVLDMATRGSAAALHWGDGLGSLAPGSPADFIALDLTSPNMQPVHRIVSNLVYAATGLENRLTVVDGRELYRDGRYLTTDYDALCAEMEEMRQWVLKQS